MTQDARVFMSIKLLITTKNGCNRYIVVMFESFNIIQSPVVSQKISLHVV